MPTNTKPAAAPHAQGKGDARAIDHMSGCCEPGDRAWADVAAADLDDDDGDATLCTTRHLELALREYELASDRRADVVRDALDGDEGAWAAAASWCGICHPRRAGAEEVDP